MKCRLMMWVLFALSASLACVCSAVTTYTKTVDGITWTYTVSSDNTATVGSGDFSSGRAVPKSTAGAIIIPRSLNGHKVVAIADNAFDQCASIVSVEIPDTVTSIGQYAFSYCESLESVNIPDSMEEIGGNAFIMCRSMRGEMTLPKGLKKLGEGAIDGCTITKLIVKATDFRSNSPFNVGYNGYSFGCPDLRDIEIPSCAKPLEYRFPNSYEKITNIVVTSTEEAVGDSAFRGCKSLKTILLPETIKAYESQSFDGCASLEKINNISEATKIGEYAFYDCVSLKGIGSLPHLKELGRYAFHSCASISDISLPNEITVLPECVFCGCGSLVSVGMSENVSTVERLAFFNCSNLVSIALSSALKEVGEAAFEHCSRLSSVSIAEDVEDVVIGDYAFGDCEKLQSVYLPSGVKKIGKECFCGCVSMKSFTASASIANWCFLGCTSLERIDLREGCVVLGERSFDGCSSVKSVSLNEGLKNIGEWAFRECENLQEIVIPNSVTNIGEYAFYKCESATNIIIGSSVKTIGDEAFYGCKRFQSLIVPPDTLTIGTWAFGYCSALKSVIVSNELKYVSCGDWGEERTAGLTAIGAHSFESCVSLTSFDFGKTVETIGENAFAYCGVMADIHLPPYSLTRIGKNAFECCESIEEIFIPRSVTALGNTVFDQCWRLKDVILSCLATAPQDVFGDSASNWGYRACNPKRVLVPCDKYWKYTGGYFAGRPDDIVCVLQPPSINPAGAMTLTKPVKVSITSEWAQAEIHYTTDGSEPNEQSPIFTTMTVSTPMTIKAIAYIADVGRSEVATASFGTGKVETPTIQTEDGQTIVGMAIYYHKGFKLKISCPTDGAEIHYTLDGLTPTIDSPLYNNGIKLDADSVRVKAIAIKSGCIASDVAEAYLERGWEKTPAPTIASKSGTTTFNHSGEVITLTCALEGAEIYYKLNESQPIGEWLKYTAPFAIDATSTIRAVAVKDDYLESDSAVATFTRIWLPTATPTIASTSGATSFDSGELTIVLDGGEGATLYYTLDGSVPSVASGIKYIGPFAIDDTTTVKVLSVREDYLNSEIAEMTFTRNWNQVAKPQIKSDYNGVETATLEGSALRVTMTCETEDAVIHYTLDGSAPTKESTVYLSPFMVDASVVIKAVAVKEEWKDSQIKTLRITKVWTAGDSLNLPDAKFVSEGAAEWVTDDEVSHDGIASMRSGAIGDDETSILKTTVSGHGKVVFWWKSSCEKTDSPNVLWWDYGTFSVDGKEVAWIDGETEWTKCEVVIAEDGEHELSWKYVKDYDEDEGEDCIWVDEIEFELTETIAPPVFDSESNEFFGSTKVVVRSATQGAAIYYTTDGTVPTSDSILYSDGVMISDTTTIKAVAVKGDLCSEIVECTFVRMTRQVSTPEISVESSSADGAKIVSISCDTEGATIWYTTDGTMPTENCAQYCEPFSINETTTIKAVAVKEGFDSSDVLMVLVKVNRSSVSSDSALYMVIDLEGGANAPAFGVNYLDSMPNGGWGREYKTTRLVLRRIDAGVFTMGDIVHDGNARGGVAPCPKVKISHPFYISVFELTQSQALLISGNRRSTKFANYANSDARPADEFSYDLIRGKNKGALWPTSDAVDSDSLMGVLRSKTGVLFDIPTEAEWEYACRANTQTDYNSGKNYSDWGFCAEANEVGRYWYSGGSSDGTAAVGSYAPNAWGLYDMHGNVFEWCRDWYSDTLTANVSDPTGPQVGTQRVMRGGYWHFDADGISSFSRNAKDSDDCHLDYPGGGVRLAAYGFFDSSAPDVEIIETVATPKFDSDSVDFMGSVKFVAISCATEGAKIYYTLDGSEPTTDSFLYLTQIKVKDTTTIKAKAYKDGCEDSEVTTLTMTKKWTIGDTLNAPDQSFESEASLYSKDGWIHDSMVSHDGKMSVRCADILNGETTTMRTSVQGKGSVIFWWKASCERDIERKYRVDHGAFLIDGKEVALIDGGEDGAVRHETEWMKVRVEINTDGPHELIWRYSKDDEDFDGEDCIWVDEFAWMPSDGTAVTKLNDVAVPYSWLYEHGLLDAHSPEIAVTMKTGKRDGAGRELTVEDDFVAGTNPNDADSQFKVSIALEDGKPIVKWDPDLNEDGTKNLRKYTTWGCKSLGGTWADYDSVADADKDLFRFFKVTVSMP